jgi:hypothetical protein|tara:strand:- start:472 stop:1203 length:732 start_codon:yes stop_codon:yes gene_type:complete
MTRKEELEKLKIDEHYYGDFGKQFLSNSDIFKLLNNPLSLREPQEQIPAFLVGGYFHTAILEPEKLKNFKIVEATTRNTKIYKELSDGKMCLLQSEVDKLNEMIDITMSNEFCKSLIKGDNVEYEVPGIAEINGRLWKGKADIINHDKKLIVDLKTTADISKFRYSAQKYNYNSQAYIYRELFGYELMFIVIDKKTYQIGIYDCSPEFYAKGKDKVEKACEVYEMFYENPDFNAQNYFINQTL